MESSILMSETGGLSFQFEDLIILKRQTIEIRHCRHKFRAQ